MISARLNRSRPGPKPGGEAAGITQPIKAPTAPEGFIPEIDGALIEYLRRAYPITLDPSYDLRAYDRQLGAKMVIDHLAALHEEQNK